MTARPQLHELVIAVDARTRFYIAAEAAPIGSVAQGIAKREYQEAQAEALRIESELGAYIQALETRAGSVTLDRKRS